MLQNGYLKEIQAKNDLLDCQNFFDLQNYQSVQQENDLYNLNELGKWSQNENVNILKICSQTEQTTPKNQRILNMQQQKFHFNKNNLDPLCSVKNQNQVPATIFKERQLQSLHSIENRKKNQGCNNNLMRTIQFSFNNLNQSGAESESFYKQKQFKAKAVSRISQKIKSKPQSPSNRSELSQYDIISAKNSRCEDQKNQNDQQKNVCCIVLGHHNQSIKNNRLANKHIVDQNQQIKNQIANQQIERLKQQQNILNKQLMHQFLMQQRKITGIQGKQHENSASGFEQKMSHLTRKIVNQNLQNMVKIRQINTLCNKEQVIYQQKLAQQNNSMMASITAQNTTGLGIIPDIGNINSSMRATIALHDSSNTRQGSSYYHNSQQSIGDDQSILENKQKRQKKTKIKNCFQFENFIIQNSSGQFLPQKEPQNQIKRKYNIYNGLQKTQWQQQQYNSHENQCLDIEQFYNISAPKQEKKIQSMRLRQKSFQSETNDSK